MKNAFTLLFVILSLSRVSFALPKEIYLSPGVSFHLPVPRGLPIHVSNGAVLRARDKGSSLLLIGRKPGESELIIGNQKQVVKVLPARSYKTILALSEFLKNRMGILLVHSEIGVQIQGDLLRWRDWEELASLARQQDLGYFFRAKMNSQLHATARKFLNSKLKEIGISGGHLSFEDGVRATFPKESEASRARIAAILSPYGIEFDFQKSLIDAEPMIEVQITLAEIQRQLSHKFGVSWPAAFKAQLLPAYSPESVSAMVTALEESGKAKVLATPRLSCKSGKEATFLAGGEIPIRIMNFKVNDITWKRYGVLLNIKPTADLTGRMSIGVETEVSMIDPGHTVDGVPGFLTNRLQSHFLLDGSKTISLSGLIKEEWGRSQSGLPGLQNIPILGPLFSSRDFRENKTELVVFVSARIQDQAEGPSLNLPRDTDE